MLRFAPSPTGEMTISDLRVAILNYIVAKQKGENFIVRIQDLDKERNITGKDTEFMEILEKFALPHDSVSHQSENLHMHQTLAIRLLEEKKAFVCTCKNEKEPYDDHCLKTDALDIAKFKEEKTPFVIRIKPPTDPIENQDILKGSSTTMPNELDAFVILKSDGTPSQTFATACDDMISGVTLVMRQEEYFSDMPKETYIKSLLGYEEETNYAHLPALLDEAGENLDLQSNATIKWLFEEGFIPDAIVNYLISLGFETPSEFFIMPQALEWFDITKLSQMPVTFEIETLKRINREHLAMMSNRDLSTLFGFADEEVGKLAKLYLKEVSTINALESKIRPIFEPKDFSGTYGTQMRTLSDIIFNAPMINDYEAFKAHLKKESGFEEEVLMSVLRPLLTGSNDETELSQIYPHIKSYILEVAS
jgi:glutamyl-tRNA synthetase